MTEVRHCNCESEFQDKLYGKGMRLHNIMGDGPKCRCTVCGKEYSPNVKK